jgi:hypothetical protein
MVPVMSFSLAYSSSTVISYMAWVAWPPIFLHPGSSHMPAPINEVSVQEGVVGDGRAGGDSELLATHSHLPLLLGGPALLGLHPPWLPEGEVPDNSAC